MIPALKAVLGFPRVELEDGELQALPAGLVLRPRSSSLVRRGV